MEEKVRVLLVDDSALVRDLLVKALSSPDNGLEIVGAAINGQDGLEKLSALKPDVVVTDMDMPVMNGLEFIRQAMARNPLPIIVLSSWTQNDKTITLQALEAGAADFIPKPSALNPQGFQETLSRLVVKIKAAARIAHTIARKPVSTPPSETFLPQTKPPVFSPSQSAPAANQSLPQVPNYEERMPQIIIGVGEFGASNEYGKIIKTFALGSCVALNLFSPTFDVVGMVHIALASSATSPEKAKVLPGYFADTAIPVLINELRAKGYRKPVSQLIAKIAGGAQTSADSSNYFKIGEKNISAVKTLLQALNISLASEDVGDSFSRTVFIQVGSKALHLSSPERKPWVI